MRKPSNLGLSWIKQCDFMAPPISLTIGGSSGLKTYFGVLMAACYMVSIIGLGWFIVSRFFDLTSPDVSEEISNSDAFPPFDIVEQQLFPVSFFFLDQSDRIPSSEVSRYVTVKLNILKKISNRDSGRESRVISKEFDVLPCEQVLPVESQRRRYSLYKESAYFSQFAHQYGMCILIDEENLKIYGGGADDEIVTLAYTLYPCSLSTGCADLQEIDRVSFKYSIPSTSINISNFETPISKIASFDRVGALIRDLTQIITFKLTAKQVIDDPGLYMKLKAREIIATPSPPSSVLKRRSTNLVSCSDEGITSQNCLPLFVIELESSGTNTRLFRKYRGAVETIGDVGGVNSLVFLICLYVNYAYLSIYEQQLVIRKVFSFFSHPLFTQKKQRSDSKGFSINKSKVLDAKEDSNSKDEERARETERKQLKELEGSAFRLVLDSLDIVNLVNELNNLKLLSHLLLKEHHRTVLPLVCMRLGRPGQHNSKDQQGESLGRPDKPDASGLGSLRRRGTTLGVSASSNQKLFQAIQRIADEKAELTSLKEDSSQAREDPTGVLTQSFLQCLDAGGDHYFKLFCNVYAEPRTPEINEQEKHAQFGGTKTRILRPTLLEIPENLDDPEGSSLNEGSLPKIKTNPLVERSPLSSFKRSVPYLLGTPNNKIRKKLSLKKVSQSPY